MGRRNVAVAVGRPRQRVRENGGPRQRYARTRDRLRPTGGRAGAAGGRADDGVRRAAGSGAIDPTSVTMATVPNKSSATLQPPAARRSQPAPSPAKAGGFRRVFAIKKAGEGQQRSGAENPPAGPTCATVLALAPCEKTRTSCRIDRKSPTDADGSESF